MMQKDGTVKYFCVETQHRSGGNPNGKLFWGEPSDFLIARVPVGLRWGEGRTRLEPWLSRERFADRGEGWTDPVKAAQAYKQLRGAMPDRQWRIVEKTVSQRRIEVIVPDDGHVLDC